MPLQHAYAVTNRLTGLAAAKFTVSTGATTNRERLNDGQMDSQFDAGTGSTMNIDMDLDASLSVAAIALLNSNIAGAVAPTITITGATNAAFTTGVVTAKALTAFNPTAPRNKDHVFQFAAVAKQYWRLALAFGGSFNFKVGELFVAAPTALTRYSIFGHGGQEEFRTSRIELANGGLRSHFIAGPIRTRRVKLADLSATEREEVYTMWRAARGPATPLLWIEQYEAVGTAADNDHQEAYFGRLDVQALTWEESDYGRFEIGELIIRNLGREVGS